MKKILQKILLVVFVIGLYLSPISISQNLELNIQYSHAELTDQEKAEIIEDLTQSSGLTGSDLEKLIEETITSKENQQQTTVATTNQTANNAAEKDAFVGYLSCSWVKLDIGCGIANFFHLLVVFVGNIFVGLAGMFLDFFLQHSITSASYKDATFINTGWEILRDLTNIVFIFALLTVAFKMVLGQNDGDNKKKLIRTILIALVVNFSLFGSYLVIDAGNLLANIFYNKIGAPESTYSGVTVDDQTTQTLTDKSVSLAIANRFHPQQLLNASGNTSTNADNYGQRLVLIFIVGIINGVIIYTFLSVAFLFLGRTVGLYISTMLSALALASLTIPGAEKIPYVGFSEWLKQLASLSFMAPVFLFFLYISVQFMNVTLFSTMDSNANTIDPGFIQGILNVLVPMAAVVAIILLSKKVATSMAGKLGGIVAEYATKGVGIAVGGASLGFAGGAAALGGASRFAGAILTKGGAKSAGSFLSNVGKSAQATNFNFAQSRIGKFAAQKTGINMGENLGSLSYSRLDTAARGTTNNARRHYDNIIQGKTPESVKNWQDNLDKSRDELRDSRLANRKENAEENASAVLETTSTVTRDDQGNLVRNNNGEVQIETNSELLSAGEVRDRIEELQSELVQQDTAAKIAEKNAVKASKKAIQDDIDKENDNLSETNKVISELTKKIATYTETTTELTQKYNNIRDEKDTLSNLPATTDPDEQARRTAQIATLDRQEQQAEQKLNAHTSVNEADLEAEKVAAQNKRNGHREDIERLKKAQEKVEENTTISGRIKQLEKVLSNAAQDAQAAMFTNDMENRLTTQDSSATLGRTQRQARVQRSAARTQQNNNSNSQ